MAGHQRRVAGKPSRAAWSKIVRAGAMPVTLGGNSGPSTYAVIQGVSAAADGLVDVHAVPSGQAAPATRSSHAYWNAVSRHLA